jgi:hypothetical protein
VGDRATASDGDLILYATAACLSGLRPYQIQRLRRSTPPAIRSAVVAGRPYLHLADVLRAATAMRARRGGLVATIGTT